MGDLQKHSGCPFCGAQAVVLEVDASGDEFRRLRTYQCKSKDEHIFQTVETVSLSPVTNREEQFLYNRNDPLGEKIDEHAILYGSSWNEIIKALAANPNLMFSLEPRKFEELVAEILSREGLEVSLTPRTRDGGKDILAYSKSVFGNHLFLVECKRYAPDRPVGIACVQRLHGVVEWTNATAGIIATTSRFTKDAVRFAETIENRMNLNEYRHLVNWLKNLSEI